ARPYGQSPVSFVGRRCAVLGRSCHGLVNLDRGAAGWIDDRLHGFAGKTDRARRPAAPSRPRRTGARPGQLSARPEGASAGARARGAGAHRCRGRNHPRNGRSDLLWTRPGAARCGRSVGAGPDRGPGRTGRRGVQRPAKPDGTLPPRLTAKGKAVTASAHRPIKAVLFDKDGTLIDFHKTWAPTFYELITEVAGGDEELMVRLARPCGYHLEDRLFAPTSIMVAGSNEEFALIWAEMLGIADHVGFLREVDQSLGRLSLPHLSPFNDLHTVLDRL